MQGIHETSEACSLVDTWSRRPRYDFLIVQKLMEKPFILKRSNAFPLGKIICRASQEYFPMKEMKNAPAKPGK